MKRFLMILMFLCVMLAAVACDEKKTAGNESDQKVTAMPTTDTKPTAEATEAPKSEATPTAEPTATTEPTPTEAVAPTNAPLPTRIPMPSIPEEIPDGCVLEWMPVKTVYYTTGGILGRELTDRDYDENGNVLWEVWSKEIDASESGYEGKVWKEIARRETSYENGRIVKELLRDETGAVKTITYAYDENGTETRTFLEADCSVNRTDAFEYGKDGNLLRKTRTKNGVSTVLYEAEYDASGRILREVKCETDDGGVYYLVSEFRYSDNGSVQTTVRSNDREGKKIVSLRETGCDSEGKTTREEYKEFASDNAVVYHSVCEYEYASGRVVKKTETIDSTELGIENKIEVTEYKYEFDTEGRMTKLTVLEDGVGPWERTWEYSADGRTVQYTERLFNVDGSIHVETKDEFRYDEHGNLLMHSCSGEEYFEYDTEYAPRVITEKLHEQLAAGDSDLTKNDEF